MARERAHDCFAVKLLADMNISPETVSFLAGLGHDVVRFDAVTSRDASDEALIELAARTDRVVVTQDLDFSA